MEGQLEVKGLCILSVTCQAEAYACDVGHLQWSEPKKGGKFSWCQGKSLRELAENICNKLAKSFEFDLCLLFQSGSRIPYTLYI